MLIIPAVTARFWTDRTDWLIGIAGLVGGVAGYLGAALSASAPHLPTGPVIVLVCFALFSTSIIFSPNRGVLAAILRRRRFQVRVHRRQGPLSLAHGETILDPLTLTVLRQAGFIRRDSAPTETGLEQAAKVLRDERRWQVARQIHHDEAVASRYDGLTPIETVLTEDEIAAIDDRIAGSATAGGIR